MSQWDFHNISAMSNFFMQDEVFGFFTLIPISGRKKYEIDEVELSKDYAFGQCELSFYC